MLIKKFMIATVMMATMLMPGTGAADDRTIYVRYDPGGDLGLYQVKAQVAKELKLNVVIDGVCASACTLLINLPNSQLCVTERARLHFHRARLQKPIRNGRKILRDANRMMLASYPAGVRQWIAQRGGLTDRMLKMDSADVSRFFRRCGKPMLVS